MRCEEVLIQHSFYYCFLPFIISTSNSLYIGFSNHQIIIFINRWLAQCETFSNSQSSSKKEIFPKNELFIKITNFFKNIDFFQKMFKIFFIFRICEFFWYFYIFLIFFISKGTHPKHLIEFSFIKSRMDKVAFQKIIYLYVCHFASPKKFSP